MRHPLNVKDFNRQSSLLAKTGALYYVERAIAILNDADDVEAEDLQSCADNLRLSIAELEGQVVS